MKHNLTLIDGGMGQELIHRSKRKPDGLWSARVMLDEYDLVVNLHKDFIYIINIKYCFNIIQYRILILLNASLFDVCR